MIMGDPIYLDYNGTTPVDPEVLDAMLPFLRGEFGNPSSATPLGARAKAAIERARGEVAALIGADSFEVVFTSGGTEASNQAIFGFAGCAPSSRRKIVSSTVEHPATEMPLRRLAEQTFSVVRAPVARNGIVDVVEAAAEIDASTELVTIIRLRPAACARMHGRSAACATRCGRGCRRELPVSFESGTAPRACPIP